MKFQIILRNEIPGNNNLFKVTGTFIFVLKQTQITKQNKTLASFHYIMNPCIFGTYTYSKSVAYLEPWNILKFDWNTSVHI